MDVDQSVEPAKNMNFSREIYLRLKFTFTETGNISEK